MVSVAISCKKDVVSDYEEAEDVVIYDMDARKIVLRTKKPPNPDLLEDLVEDFDICALIAAGITPENRVVLEDMGLKLILVQRDTLNNILAEIFV